MLSTKPVIVEGNPPTTLESKAVYSNHWQLLQTGEMLLRTPLPRIIEHVRVTVISNAPPPKERIFETKVAALKTIPSKAIALKAVSMLRTREETSDAAWGISVSGIGNFTPSAAKLLPTAAQTKLFVDNLKEMLGWINNRSDVAFIDWFRCILLDTPGVIAKTFQPTASAPLGISSVLDLHGEIHIDDEIVRVVMELFSDSYGMDDRYMFIPPVQVELWKGNLGKDWRKSKVKSGRVQKAFSVVHMPGHWGAIEVDFVKRIISFGDSLSYPVPNNTIEAVRDWIQCCRGDMDQWSSHVEQFAVPRQPASSGSCAVNAINAVEMSVNPRTERWTHLKSAHHRLRLLKLVTGFSKPSSSDGNVTHSEVAHVKVTQDKIACSDVAQDKATCSNVVQDKATRSNVAQDKIACNDVAQDKATCSNVVQDKIARSDVAQDKATRSNVAQGKIAH
ncbi:hypothetical protein BGZ93_003344, partial [Podila epicladia]